MKICCWPWASILGGIIRIPQSMNMAMRPGTRYVESPFPSSTSKNVISEIFIPTAMKYSPKIILKNPIINHKKWIHFTIKPCILMHVLGLKLPNHQLELLPPTIILCRKFSPYAWNLETIIQALDLTGRQRMGCAAKGKRWVCHFSR